MRNLINIIVENADTDWNAEMKKLDKEAAALTKGLKGKLKAPRPEDLALFDRVREVIRHQEGMGGQCHEVSGWIDHYYGWPYIAGTYLSDSGEPVCTYHFWNMLPDGSILDTTPDQHGEDGRSIRLIHPNDPEAQKYTCEWCEDWNPHHADYEHHKDWDYHNNWPGDKRDPAKYSGKPDADRENELKDQHGGRWWHIPAEKQQFVDAYKEKEKGYGDHSEW